MLRKRTGKKLIRIQTAIMAVFLVCLNIVIPVSECYASEFSEQIVLEDENLGELEQVVEEQVDDTLVDEALTDEVIAVDEALTDETNADVVVDELVIDEDEEIIVEMSQEIIPEMLSWQDNDELFEEYVNEVMFQQMGAEDILQQSEIADMESDKAGDSSLDFRGAVARYAAPAMSAKGFNLTELQSAMVDAFATFAGRVADGEVENTNLVISFVEPDGEENIQESNYMRVDCSGNVFYFEELGVNKEKAKRIIIDNYIVFQKVFDAAIYNNPYLFYWNDKTGGTSMVVKFGLLPDRIRIREITINFSVSPDYSSGEPDSRGRYYTTDLNKTAAAKEAVLEAKRVVAENAALSDYHKLCAYRDYIYSAVSYNYSALNADSYGAAWQLIYAFDKDPSTNVVCEGYAKAFKYLCDLTDFDDDNIYCALMGGYMSSGRTPAGHMWNILTMPDGKHYMVDLTNSDDGNTGSGYLFLKGYNGTGTDLNVPANCQNGYYRYASKYSNLKYYAFKKFEEYYAGSDIMQLSQTDYVYNHVHQYVNGYCAKCDSYYSSKIVLEGCSLKVGNTAVLSVYISDAGDWKANADNYLKLVYKNDETEVIKVSDIENIQQNGKDMLMFDCEFDMRQLADTVKIYFYDADNNGYYIDKGPEKGKQITYTVSVKDYASRLANTKCATEVKNCLQTILLYGGAVQKYTEYNTDVLASAGANGHIKTIEDTDMKRFANSNPVMIRYFGAHKAVTYKDIRMSFAGKTEMKVYLSLSQSADTFKCFVDGNETLINKDSHGYYAAISNVMPTNYSKLHTVTIKSKASGDSVLEIKVSPYNWVRMTLDGENGSNAALKATARYVYYLGRYGKNE